MGLTMFDGAKPGSAPIDSLMYVMLKGGWHSSRSELCLCKEKMEERAMKKLWAKGGNAKQGVVVLKTSVSSGPKASNPGGLLSIGQC